VYVPKPELKKLASEHINIFSLSDDI